MVAKIVVKKLKNCSNLTGDASGRPFTKEGQK
jgi:hypothetical protein